MRLFLALALVLTASTALPAGQTTSSRPPTLDVVVEDSRGKAVENLGPSDFTVTEQSRPVAVAGVRFVRAAAKAPGVTATPVSAAERASDPDVGSVIAIYLDEFHVAPGASAEQVRAALISLVTESIEPSDQLIVLKSLDSLLEIKPVKSSSEAIQKLESFAPRRGDYEPRTTFERNFLAGTPARIESARAQIATSSLEALATELGRMSADRKSLIVVSEGFAKNTRRRAEALLPTLDSVILAANRAHVSIYPFDPSAMSQPGSTGDTAADNADDSARWREVLRSLADGTSGRTIAKSGDAAGLKRALNESRGYYELTLTTDVAHDGHFHTVDVTLRRPGVTARARKGYWAASDREPPSFRTAFASSAIPVGAQIARRSSPLIRPWFGISKTADGQTEVSFVWEPSPRVPGERNPPPPLAQIALSVMTLEGTPVYKGIVLPATSGETDALSGQSRASFVSPAGRLVVQMTIEDVTSRVVDHDVRDLLVKGFPGPVSMGSPEVMRARTAREYDALAADPDATPVASRQFSRAERLLVRIPVFSTGEKPKVSARLVTSFGSAMRDLVVAPTPSRPNEYQVDVPLAALSNGSYTVEWTARTAEGEIHDRVAFRVTP
jgi:VWFA-related protein